MPCARLALRMQDGKSYVPDFMTVALQIWLMGAGTVQRGRRRSICACSLLNPANQRFQRGSRRQRCQQGHAVSLFSRLIMTKSTHDGVCRFL